MRFEGAVLDRILSNQMHPVQVRDHRGRVQTVYADARRAVAILDRGKYYGVGNEKRIRYIQADSAEDCVVAWGTDLGFDAMVRKRGQEISRKVNRKDLLKWATNLDRSRPGNNATVGHVWLRGSKSRGDSPEKENF